MALPVNTPRCKTRADVADLVRYRDPHSDRHIEKGRSRDPNRERMAGDFWKGCEHVAHSQLHLCGLAPEMAGDMSAVAEAFIDAATAELRDDRGRLRTGVLKLGVWNPPTDIQAALRAIPSWSERLLVASRISRELFHQVSGQFLGPLIFYTHPDRHRLHWEFLALLYDPATGHRFKWAKGLRFDGPGTSCFADNLNLQVTPRTGLNSQIATSIASFARTELAKFRDELSTDALMSYDQQVLLQTVILEATISPVGERNRTLREVKIPTETIRLTRAWTSAPGPVNIVEKVKIYSDCGLVDVRGRPFIPAFDGIRNSSELLSGSKATTPDQTPSEARRQWLEWWLRWLDRSWLRFPIYLRRKRLGAVGSIVHIDMDDGNLLLKPEIVRELRLCGSVSLPGWAAVQLSAEEKVKVVPEREKRAESPLVDHR